MWLENSTFFSPFFRNRFCHHDLKLIPSQHRPILENISHSQPQSPRIEWVQLRVSGQIMKKNHSFRQKVIILSIQPCRWEVIFFSIRKQTRKNCLVSIPGPLEIFFRIVSSLWLYHKMGTAILLPKWAQEPYGFVFVFFFSSHFAFSPHPFTEFVTVFCRPVFWDILIPLEVMGCKW